MITDRRMTASPKRSHPLWHRAHGLDRPDADNDRLRALEAPIKWLCLPRHLSSGTASSG